MLVHGRVTTEHLVPRYLFIDPFSKSNIYSFPLLTTYSAFEVILKTYSFNDVNSGKLYILGLLKGSIHLGGERQCESKVSCPRRLSPSRTRTQTARSGGEHNNHDNTTVSQQENSPGIFGFSLSLSVLSWARCLHSNVLRKYRFAAGRRIILRFMPFITISPSLGFLHKKWEIDRCAILVCELRNSRNCEVLLWFCFLW